ncbi:MAG: cytochrome c-type biogenesis protein [Pseudomonadota bacterium]
MLVRSLVIAAVIACLSALSSNTVMAQLAEQRLPVALEERAQKLFVELRCVVCQNQSIAESDADVARDLRTIVREQIASGKSDQDVVDFLVTRYGEFILLKPVLGWHTIVLWVSPVFLLLVGGWLIFRAGTSQAKRVGATLSQAEEQELAAILSKQKER